MKRLLALLLLITIVASVMSYRRNNDIRSLLIQFPESELDAATSLRYKVLLFGFIPVGSAVLHTAQLEQFKDKPVYHLRVEAESAKELSWLYVASMRADSYVDRQTLLPEAFIQKIEVKGKKNIERGVVYAQEDQTMSVEGEVRTILGDTFDPLSAIFKVGRMRYEELKDLELNINTNQKNYQLLGSAERSSELVNRTARRLITVSADIKRRNDNPYHQSHIEMVFAGEKKNTPLLIRSFTSGFLVTCRLTSVQ